MVKCYLAFLSASWSVLVVEWSWGSWKGMPHHIYLVQILLFHSQFCHTVLSTSYVKIIINNCGFKAKLFRNKATAESGLLRFKAVRGWVVPDISKNVLADWAAWSLKMTLGHIPLKHWKPLTPPNTLSHSRRPESPTLLRKPQNWHKKTVKQNSESDQKSCNKKWRKH